MTLAELLVAFGLVAAGIVVGDWLAYRRREPRGLPLDPRCFRRPKRLAP